MLFIIHMVNYQTKVYIKGGNLNCFKSHHHWGFPGGGVVKNPPANAGDMGSSPGPGRSHMLRSN